jgi:lycopene beta-cyclase
MLKPQAYDFISAGMGCAGLSLAMSLQKSDVTFSKILLIDKDHKNKNDRTWCFWTKEKENWFDEIVFRSWDKFTFESADFKNEYALDPYRYLMIQGIDFYTYCLKALKADDRFEIITEEIKSISSEDKHANLTTATHTYSAKYIFNSAFRKTRSKQKDIQYVQHFMGWVIETEEPIFNEHCPVFMNFNTEQFNDCRFFYVLPFSKNKALVEYTGFSPKRISDEEYETALKKHVEKDLGCSHYRIESVEQGEIPMTESEFVNDFGNCVINIGTAGGNSKPSTGYTFYFIQKSTQHLIAQLEKSITQLKPYRREKKFLLFDAILLDVISTKQIAPRDVFAFLFNRNPVRRLLAFLNEESSGTETLGILSTAPKQHFVPAALKKIIQNLKKV